MGPRSLDRGNGFVRPKLSEPQAVFNGAAISRSRKSSRSRIQKERDRRVFNGAAISRSRKSAGSQRPEKVAGCLQWGRDLSIAEIARQRLLHYQEFPRLQWGRDLSIAEIHRPVVWVSNIRFSSMGPRSLDRGNVWIWMWWAWVEFLQWGRDLSIAEINKRLDGFGGNVILQWGRDLSIAEM